jgi:hypothetical protein
MSNGGSSYTTSDYLEQYKSYLTDLGNVGSRYATANGFYLSAVTALLGVLALTESGKLLSSIPRVTLLVVCGFACVLCIVWTMTIAFYRKLFHSKFIVLRQLEEHVPHKCFEAEYRLLTEGGKPFLLSIEKFVPLTLLMFFVALALIRFCSANFA